MTESTLSKSKVFDWNQIPTEPNKAGFTKRFFKDQCGTLDQMSVHVTMLPPGASAHPPHAHPEEEMILLKEGSLEALHNGERKSMSAGSILFIAPNDMHGVTNNGNSQAVYYVIKWFSPGMLKK